MTRAPEINRRGLFWFNTPRPLSLADLKGRVVVLDFWTYCCINCLQILPTLRRVEEQFPTEVAVIGIHSPKYPAERRPENVAQAIARHNIRHPVAHDPAMTLWEKYAIHAWPTLVFVSPDGYVIGQRAGEPNPDALIRGLDDLVQQFAQEGSLAPPGLSDPLIEAPPPEAGPGSPGSLRFPAKIKACPGPDGARQWVVADAGHNQVALFDDGGHPIARFGSGEAALVDGGAHQACFCAPQGLVCDAQAIWVADTGNHALRRIDRATGQVSTVAGMGVRGGPLRASEPASGAALASPWDVEILGDAIYFANAGSHQIGRYDPAGGTVHRVAGTGGEDLVDGPAEHALLAQPSGLAAAGDGDRLYFVDSESSAVRLLTLAGTPAVTTLVGQGLFAFGHLNGTFDQALMQHPLGLAMAADTAQPRLAGLVVADSYNGLIRRLDLGAQLVGDVDLGACADAACLSASEPAGIAVAGPGRLLVADTNNHRIIECDLDAGYNRLWAS